ncbi:MAG: hypothetical protein IPK16_20450 [Anaerolineales bacterium]|nr:hypothetical protein [Anaerolineales bacterium]
MLADTVRSGKELLESEIARLKMHWRAGIICIGMLPDRLAVAGMGDAFAFITTDGGDVNVYPPERLAPEFDGFNNALTLWPLHRQRVDIGGALMAASGRWLQVTPARLLAGAVAFVDASNYQDAVDGLREQAGRDDLPGLLLVFSNDGGAPPPPPPSSPVPPPSDPSQQRVRASALPTAVNASPPVTGAPSEGAGEAGNGGAAAVLFTAPASQTAASAVAEDAGQLAASVDATPTHTPYAVGPAADEEASQQSGGINPAALAGAAAAVVAGAKSGIGRLGSLAGSMLPDRTVERAEASTAATIHYSVPMVAPAPARVTPIESPFTPPPRASGGRARLFVALAAVVLLLVPVVVAAMFWKIGAPDRADAAELLNLADARYRSAVEALDQEDRQTGRKLLNDARDYVTQSEEKLGRTTQSSTLMSEIERELRDVMQVTPLYGLVQPLTTFPAEADPSRLLVVDQDIYILDSGRGLVVKHRLDAGGEVLEESGEQVVLKQGDIINGVAVGQPIDFAWQMPIPGYEDKASLLVLDANNRVFRYSQVDGASLMSFGDPGNWKQAQQLEVYLASLCGGHRRQSDLSV